jgi:hypothetical protein
MCGLGSLERGQEVVREVSLVGDGRVPDEVTLTEVTRFNGAVLESGGDGESSGGPTLLIPVRWTLESVVRMAAASWTGRQDGHN